MVVQLHGAVAKFQNDTDYCRMPAHQLANPRAQKPSLPRIFRAVKFKGQTSLTTAAVFQEIQRGGQIKREEQQREGGFDDPKTVMGTLTGIQPIKLHFKGHHHTHKALLLPLASLALAEKSRKECPCEVDITRP